MKADLIRRLQAAIDDESEGIGQASPSQMDDTGQASQEADDVCDVTIEISSDMIEGAQVQDVGQQVYYEEELETVGMQQVCIVESQDQELYGLVQQQQMLQVPEASPLTVEVMETEVVDTPRREPDEKDLLEKQKEALAIEQVRLLEKEKELMSKAQQQQIMLEAEKRQQILKQTRMLQEERQQQLHQQVNVVAPSPVAVVSTHQVAVPAAQVPAPLPPRIPAAPTSMRPVTNAPMRTVSVTASPSAATTPRAPQQPVRARSAPPSAPVAAPTLRPTAPPQAVQVEASTVVQTVASQGPALHGAGGFAGTVQDGEVGATAGGVRLDGGGDVPVAEVHIPHVLEEILATSERALELGETIEVGGGDTVPEARRTVPTPKKPTRLVAVDEGDDEDEEMETPKAAPETKSKKKKKKKKRRAQRLQQQQQSEKGKKEEGAKKDGIDADIEYIQETIDSKDPYYYQFLLIFEKFKLQEPEKGKTGAGGPGDQDGQSEASIAQRLLERKKPADLDEKDDDDLLKAEEKPKLSKRKLKKLSRMSIAELKQKVGRPELVEMHDVTAKDPVLLLHLKSSRNTVPVPRHWCFKRKYLQGKRGIEKPPFDLPGFIKKTGIMEMRQALQEKEDQKTMKAKMREKVRPKLGKIDIDYQKLHDAFFKWQTKPRMTMHGDLYYEGKEFETRLKEKKPGDLSDDLRIALGMPTGPNSHKCPPPWLIAMQRYGPPPSYPNLKIPGLNAPIPDGCSFGYHAGGWGKPPVDEMGRPLYGDVFGTQSGDGSNMLPEEEVDRSLWGELESESSEESEAEEESEEEERAEDESGLVTPAEGLVTPSGFTSIPAGVETPEMIELRKRKIETDMEGGDTPSLYTVLPEKRAERVGAAMMGSTHIYDMTAALAKGARAPATGGASERPGGVEIALDPSELEMDQAAMAARYEQTLREQQSHLAKEDLSDMVAEHAARQKNKRKKQQQDSGKTTKKYKEFKF